MTRPRWRRALVAVTLAGSLLTLAGQLAPLAAAATSCRPATNVEAIVDDSLSMETSDSNRLRVQGLALLLETLPAATKLGAIEFGSGLGGMQPPADSVFGPEPIGPNAAAMEGALNAAINADNGLTDYNGAFALADAENPGAQARILLTDGALTEGEYADGHLTHDVPTYVTGFSVGLGGEDRGRLKRIAAETGGRYYPLADSGQMQAAINSIGAELTCQPPPRTFTDQLAAGEAATHTVSIGAATTTVQIALTWANPLDRSRLTRLRLLGGPRNLKVERHGSTTFSVVEVSGLSKGNLRFSVQAAKVGSGEPKVMLTTQVSEKKKGK
jgi:hypothetical protein